MCVCVRDRECEAELFASINWLNDITLGVQYSFINYVCTLYNISLEFTYLL